MADGVVRPRRVFISYAHGDAIHERRVRDLWMFLRNVGLDARLDLPAAERPLDWPMWMLREVREADFVLVVASPAYKRRAEGDEPPGKGLGVRWEARLIRQEVYDDGEAAILKFLPVVLPGCSKSDIPTWLGPDTHTHYVVDEYTVAGAKPLLRYLTDQPGIVGPVLGPVPSMPPENLGTAGSAATAGEASAPIGLRTDTKSRWLGRLTARWADVRSKQQIRCRRHSRHADLRPASIPCIFQ